MTPQTCRNALLPNSNCNNSSSNSNSNSSSSNSSGVYGEELVDGCSSSASSEGPTISTSCLSALQQLRLLAVPTLPTVLNNPIKILHSKSGGTPTTTTSDNLSGPGEEAGNEDAFVRFIADENSNAWVFHQPLRLGIVLSGNQAPGTHNVVSGVYDYLKKCNLNSQLFGFIGGLAGVQNCKQHVEINERMMNMYRNLGGFDMLQSGRDLIETEEQKQTVFQAAKILDLHGLILVGGRTALLNAAILTQYFQQKDSSVKIAAVPASVEGDLGCSELLGASLGFDTAVRIYSEFIGNLATDIATSRKYYHFVRLMGNGNSNVPLHCALLTRPNLVLIGEEIQHKRISINQIVDELVEMIVKRQDQDKDFGIVLIPEDLLSFLREFSLLAEELKCKVDRSSIAVACPSRFSSSSSAAATAESVCSPPAINTASSLSVESAKLFNSLPSLIREGLVSNCCSLHHAGAAGAAGKVDLSKIEPERILILMAKERLASIGRGERFIPRSHFFGYEGRSGLPSEFDSNYSYALGHLAAAFIDNGMSGYVTVLSNLDQHVTNWVPGGCLLSGLMTAGEADNSKQTTLVVKKNKVRMNDVPFQLFCEVRDLWKYEDLYSCPGPLQFVYNVDSKPAPPTASSLCSFTANLNKEYLLPERTFGFEALKSRSFFPKSFEQLSHLQRERLKAPVEIPEILYNPRLVLASTGKYDFLDMQTEAGISRSYPLQFQKHKRRIYSIAEGIAAKPLLHLLEKPLRIGILLNGQQASGVANVLLGLWERLSLESPRGKVFGFIGGVKGLLNQPAKYIEIQRDDLSLSRNQGGFELLGREKEAEMLLATTEGFQRAAVVCEQELRLDGLVLIGGRYTLSCVAILTEEFLRRSISTRVIGVPATQNNNLDTSIIESALGFDSASKCYNQLVGNLSSYGASCGKFWLFIRLMGSDKSQIAMEAALATHPNVTLVSEANGDKTLSDIVADIADVVVNRASAGLNFGSLLIPEGLISSLPQFRMLLSELKLLFSNITSVASAMETARALVNMDNNNSSSSRTAAASIPLSPWSKQLLQSLPRSFREHLVQPRSLGQLELLTRITTEELLAEMVADELRRREKLGLCSRFSFVPLCFYFGYQARSSLPSKFDCSLGLSHGYLASIAVKANLTGYVTCFKCLASPPCEWLPTLYPVAAFLRLPSHQTDAELFPPKCPTVPSDMVKLNGKAFQTLQLKQHQWEHEDHYSNPGPIQFAGEASKSTTHSLSAEQKNYLDMLSTVRRHVKFIKQLCGSGASETALQISVETLSMVNRLYRDQQASHHHYQ